MESVFVEKWSDHSQPSFYCKNEASVQRRDSQRKRNEMRPHDPAVEFSRGVT